MASGPIHLHGDDIAAPECHEQLDKDGPTLIGDKMDIGLTHPLPQEALDRWVLFWGHEHMDASAIRAQQPTSEFPVTQVRCRGDKPSGGLQHRLQVFEPLHPGHIRLLERLRPTIEC
jgi:hypothetical protein